MFLPTAAMRFWTNQSLAVKGLVVVALPLAILIAALTLLFLASRAEAVAEDDVRLAFAIQRDTHQVHALLAEAAGGVRGYLLTKQERFLDPYEKAEIELPKTLGRLDLSIQDRTVRDRFEQVISLSEQKREGLSDLLVIARNETLNSDQAVVQAALAANKDVLDQLRREIDLIQQLESNLLEIRRQRVDDVRESYLALTAVSGLIGLLGSLVAVYLFSTGIVKRVQRLEGNAQRLEQGLALEAFPQDQDEIGSLANRLERASDLLRAREQALREGEERFRLVIEGVRDYGIFALDPSGYVTSWNTGAERIKGWPAEEILGQHFSRFYPEETRSFLPATILSRAANEGTAEDEGWRLRKDGGRFWANVVVTALRDDTGALRGFAKVTRDITERRRSEDALRIAREEAVAANLAKSEFLSRTSHELRTPMSAILGFAQVLELDEATMTVDQRSAVGQILKAGRHLLSLIDELLDITSIEAGGAALTLTDVPLEEVISEASDLASPMLTAAGLELFVDCPAPALTIRADRRRTVQVLLNLLSNAAKYARNGRRVDVRFRVEEAWIKFEILDEGPGVDPASISRLFTPFDRLGRHKLRGTEGTGLGLALSKRLVEAMGGDIGFTNRSSATGAAFWFTLPRGSSRQSG
ncbi:MAG TPA: histidine kinase [Hyphomonas sp.]|nr:histidine kinase [Hyphomonas sp.]